MGTSEGQTTSSGGTGRTARGLSPFGSLVNHEVNVKCPVLSSPAVASQKDKGPMGEPRKSKPSLAMGISAGRGL